MRHFLFQAGKGCVVLNYLVTAAERAQSGSTAYYEFQPGAFRHRFWQADSLYLSASLFEQTGLGAFLGEHLPGFSPFGVTRVTKRAWEALLEASGAAEEPVRELIAELRPWARNCFGKRRVFHILGL